MYHTDKCSQHSSIIWPVSLNVWVFVYELSGVVGLSPVAVMSKRNIPVKEDMFYNLLQSYYPHSHQSL